jgi:hypothetical protein
MVLCPAVDVDACGKLARKEGGLLSLSLSVGDSRTGSGRPGSDLTHNLRPLLPPYRRILLPIPLPSLHIAGNSLSPLIGHLDLSGVSSPATGAAPRQQLTTWRHHRLGRLISGLVRDWSLIAHSTCTRPPNLPQHGQRLFHAPASEGDAYL